MAMSQSAEILCSRCGTPFPQERGKASVTCVVCGQLRPDLDMTLDDDDDDLASALGAGAAGASLRPSVEAAAHVDEPLPQPTHVVLPRETPQDETFRIGRPFVSMSDDPPARPVRSRRVGESLTDLIGPVLLIVAPLASGMAGALNMLQSVPDFSKGSWYAVGSVFVAILCVTLFGSLIASGMFYLVRARWKMLIRGVFFAAAVAIAYYSVTQLPRHIQVRTDDLPGFVMR